MRASENATGGAQAQPATRIIVRVAVYYAMLIAAGSVAWHLLPRGGAIAPTSLDSLFGGGPPVSRAAPAAALDETGLAVTVGVAMLAAILLALPVAWIYRLTRAKRGYQQSVVQLLVVLPAVVAGIVLLVKYSLALAFSLAGIVAAVRFRNTLDDSKDAVYVFLATAIGLASAVNLPVAAIISIGFNALVLLLWYTDFGSTPVELDGRIAARRLARARRLSRTGTFVARIDDEVLRNMTRDQLEEVAARAWRRASAEDGTEEMPPPSGIRLRVSTHDVAGLRSALEPRLDEHTKRWRLEGISVHDGAEMLEYEVQLRKRSSPEELLSLARAAGSSRLVSAQVDG